MGYFKHSTNLNLISTFKHNFNSQLIRWCRSKKPKQNFSQKNNKTITNHYAAVTSSKKLETYASIRDKTETSFFTSFLRSTFVSFCLKIPQNRIMPKQFYPIFRIYKVKTSCKNQEKSWHRFVVIKSRKHILERFLPQNPSTRFLLKII